MIPPPPLMPLPDTMSEVTTGAVVSSVKFNAAEPVKPAALVSLAVRAYELSARPTGANDHTPLALAVVLPRTVLPVIILTTAFGSAVPVSASFKVILSVAETPVSWARDIVTAGAVGGGEADEAGFQPSRLSSVRSDCVTELTTPGLAKALN